MKTLTKAFAIAAVAGTVFAHGATAAIAPINAKGFNSGFEAFLAEKYDFKAVTASWERFVAENTPIELKVKDYSALVKLSFDRVVEENVDVLPATKRSQQELAIAGWNKVIG